MTIKQIIKRILPRPAVTAISQLRSQLGQPHAHELPKSNQMEIIFDNPSEMTIAERFFLYALVRGIRPKRVLEIGTRHGGSAAIITKAMEDIDTGILIGLDPSPEITVSQEQFYGRFHLIAKPSPEATAEASSAANGLFDLVFIDGIHIYEQVKKDIEGCLPYIAIDGYILLHDALNFGVSEAIRHAVESNSNLFDCGYVCTKPGMANPLLAYKGLRMLRVGPSTVSDPQPILAQAYHAAGKPLPSRDPDLLNHDPFYYCRFIQPCPYCQKKAST